MSYRILLIEDNPLQLVKLEALIKNQGYEVAGTADNGEEAIRLLRAVKPDLALIDIQLNGIKTGIDVGQFLQDEGEIPFLFLTSLIDDETLEKAAKTNPEAYLVKPVDENSLRAAIEVVRKKEALEAAELVENSLNDTALQGTSKLKDSLFIRVGKLFKRIFFSDIVLVTATQSNYTALILESGEKYEIRQSLTSLESRLPLEYCRVHRKQIVNCKFIENVKTDFSSIKISGQEEIPVGRTYRKTIADRIIHLS